jgi:hypothetical protein
VRSVPGPAATPAAAGIGDASNSASGRRAVLRTEIVIYPHPPLPVPCSGKNVPKREPGRSVQSVPDMEPCLRRTEFLSRGPGFRAKERAGRVGIRFRYR